MKLTVPRPMWIAIPTAALVIAAVGVQVGWPIYRQVAAKRLIEQHNKKGIAGLVRAAMRLSVPRPLTLFLLTITLVLVGLSLRFGYPIYRQQMAIREVRRLGGDVEMRLNCPEWLEDRLPKWCLVLGHVSGVGLGTLEVTDADLAVLRSFPEVEYLSLENSQVTNAGLAELSSCERIEELVLDRTRVTDAGLRHLERLKRLRRLHIIGCAVTREGIARLDANGSHHLYIIDSNWW